MANNTGTFFNINDNDGIPLVGVSTDGKVMINHLYGNCLIGSTSATGTASQPLQVTGGAYVSGSVGIGTTNPSAKLHIVGDTQFDGNVRVGISTTSNYIAFRGTYNDDQIPYTNTFIGERIYDYSGVYAERSELLLFKGNDRSLDTSGPDRIRLAAAELRFDTYSTTTTPLSFESAATLENITNKMILTGNGNLGIGTTNPVVKLHVENGNLFVGNAITPTIGVNTGSIFLNGPSRRGIHWAATSDTHYVKLESDVIDGLTINGYSGVAFATGSRTNSTWAERMRMDINGNLGVGTNNPTRILDIYSASGSNTVKLTANGTSAGFVVDSVGVSSRGGYYSAYQGGVQRAVFGVSGTVEGNTTSDAAIFADGTGGNIRFYSNGSITEVARITSSGSVGIGTTNPTSKVQVVGGDIRVGIDTSQGVVLTSANGTKYRLIVSNAGALSTVLVP